MADSQIRTIVQLLCSQSSAQKPQDGQPAHAQNVVPLPKKVLAALQAAQLLPTD